jgi:hypothetical protein
LKHEGLDFKTPAEACGITIVGKNKWKTLMQNASEAYSFQLWIKKMINKLSMSEIYQVMTFPKSKMKTI